MSSLDLFRMITQGDEATDRFLRVLLELAVAHCLASEAGAAGGPAGSRPGALSFLAVCVSLADLRLASTASAQGWRGLDPYTVFLPNSVIAALLQVHMADVGHLATCH